MRELVIAAKVADRKAPGAYLECVRTLDGTYFDELAITKLEISAMGYSVHVEYERFRARLRDLSPVVVAASDFAFAAKDCRLENGAVDFEKFAKTPLVKRLFDNAARQWSERNKKSTENFMDDIAFLDDLKASTAPAK